MRYRTDFSSEEREHHTESPQSHNQLIKRALIIDDEPGICNILKEMLELSHFDADTAATGEEGLERILRDDQDFDLIMLDMNMPGINGAEVYDELKRQKYTAEIILLSGYSEQHVSSLISADGDSAKACVNFLRKPFTYSKLKSLLDQIFSN